MQQSEYPAFMTLLGGVYDFYSKELTQFASEIWWGACKECAYADVSRAFSDHLMDPDSGKWLPKPADLVRQLKGTKSDQSRLAWSKVMDATQRVGAYSDVVFDDAIIHVCIEDLGGWVTMCRTSYDELPHTERRFCDAYRAYAMPGRVTRWPVLLAGESGASNRLRGIEQATPAMIGDAQKCAAVMSGGSDSPKTQIAHQALQIGLTETPGKPSEAAMEALRKARGIRRAA